MRRKSSFSYYAPQSISQYICSVVFWILLQHRVFNIARDENPRHFFSLRSIKHQTFTITSHLSVHSFYIIFCFRCSLKFEVVRFLINRRWYCDHEPFHELISTEKHQIHMPFNKRSRDRNCRIK